MIELENLEKTFKVLNRKEGLKGAVADLFSKDYRYVKAVDDISLSVDKGEIIGYVGPNGAGKSTTIKMMTGILMPTAGRVLINNAEPYKNRKEHMKHIGVVFGQRSQLWWSLPVRESFRVLKEMYEVSDGDYRENLKLFESLVDLEPLYSKPVRQLSLGQRMLCEVTAAFLHNPGVVFLDEPTIGLDVAVKESIRELIKQLNKEKGTTIVLTSHDTKDIETLCKRVAIIDHGKLIFDNDLTSLREMFGKYRTLHFKFGDDRIQEQMLKNKLHTAFNENQIRIKEDTEESGVAIIINEQNISLTKVLNYVLSEYPCENVSIEDVGVEEVIRRIYQKELINNEAI